MVSANLVYFTNVYIRLRDYRLWKILLGVASICMSLVHGYMFTIPGIGTE